MATLAPIRLPEGCRLLKSFRVASTEDIEECHISAIGESGDTNIVMADWMNRSVKLFDADLRCVQSIDVPSGPRDLCVSDGTVFVVCDYDKKVHVFTLSDLESPDVSEGPAPRLVRQDCLDITECMYCQGVCRFGTQLCLSVRMKDMSGQIRVIDRDGHQLKSIATGGYYGRLTQIQENQSVAMAPLEVGVLIFINVERGEYSKRQFGDRRRVGVAGAGEGCVFAIDDRGDVALALPEDCRQVKPPNDRGREPGRGLYYRSSDETLILQRYARTDTVEIYQLMYPQSDGTTLPEEILKLDRHSVELYRNALTSGSIPDHDIRLMLVGHYGVGKTALRKRLLGEAVDVNEREATDGIEVHTRTAQVGLEDGRWRQLGAESASPQIPSADEGTNDDGDDMAVIEREENDANADGSHEVIHTRSANTGKGDNGSNVKEAETEESDILEELKGVIGAAADTTGDKSALVSIWDFAGQSVFYSTHQVFLSKRAVYLLVTDMSRHVDDIVQDDDACFDSFGEKSRKVSEFVEFWLNSIHCYCGITKPNVILVGTHADKLNQHDKTNTIDLYFRCVRNLFMDKDSKAEHVVEEEFSIDNSVTDDQGLEKLKKKILEVAADQPYWGNPIPARWITLEKAFTGLREKGLKIIPREQLPHLNEALPVPLQSEAEMDLFLTFQHDVGTILYFSEPSLREFVLLDPQWVVDAIKCLITAENFCRKKPHIAPLWKEFNTKAVLKSDLLKAVWDSDDNTKFWEHHKHIIRLMERLDLIARPRAFDGAGSTMVEDDDLYFVPCVLKEKHSPELLKPSQFETTSHLCFTTSSQFIPTAIFNRLLAACMTKWPLYKQKGKPCIFCGCGIFEVTVTHRLTVYFSQDFVQIWVTNLAKSAKPEHSVCSDARSYIEDTLNRIFSDTENAGEIQRFVKCPRAELESMGEIIGVEKFQASEEVPCTNHEETHTLKSSTMLRGWFKVKEDAAPGPATAQDKESKMSAYYCRMVTLLLDICPQPLRELFIQEAKKNSHPVYTTLDAFLLSRQPAILSRGFLKFAAQKDILYPANGVTDIAKWDITLLTLMLLKLFPSLPQVLRDPITTIREERNNFQHMCNTDKMTNQEFTQKWDTLEKAVNGIVAFLADPAIKAELAGKMKALKEEPFHTDSDSIMKSMQEFREKMTQEFKELRALTERTLSQEGAASAHEPPVTSVSSPVNQQSTSTIPEQNEAPPFQAIAAPSHSLATPLQSVAQPFQSTNAPLQNAAAPTQNGETSLQSEQAPLQSKSAAFESVAAPLQRVQSPLESIEAPLQSVPVPLESVQAPSHSTAATPQTPSASLHSAAAPLQSVQIPLKSVQMPLESVQAQSQSAEVPLQIAPPQSQSVMGPLANMATPSGSLTAPSGSMTSPSQSEPAPLHSTSAPLQSASVPLQNAPSPSQSLETPMQIVEEQLQNVKAPSLTATAPSHMDNTTTHLKELHDNNISKPEHDVTSEEQATKEPSNCQTLQGRTRLDSGAEILVTTDDQKVTDPPESQSVQYRILPAPEKDITTVHGDKTTTDPPEHLSVQNRILPDLVTAQEQNTTTQSLQSVHSQSRTDPAEMLAGPEQGLATQADTATARISLVSVLFAILGAFAIGCVCGTWFGGVQQFDKLVRFLIIASIGYFTVMYLQHNT